VLFGCLGQRAVTSGGVKFHEGNGRCFEMSFNMSPVFSGLEKTFRVLYEASALKLVSTLFPCRSQGIFQQEKKILLYSFIEHLVRDRACDRG
jgi:hypothetical protein